MCDSSFKSRPGRTGYISSLTLDFLDLGVVTSQRTRYKTQVNQHVLIAAGYAGRLKNSRPYSISEFIDALSILVPHPEMQKRLKREASAWREPIVGGRQARPYIFVAMANAEADAGAHVPRVPPALA